MLTQFSFFFRTGWHLFREAFNLHSKENYNLKMAELLLDKTISPFARWTYSVFFFSKVETSWKTKLLNMVNTLNLSDIHCIFWQVHNFTEEFYAPPVVMVTANHLYDSKNVYSIKPENNALNTWIEVSSQYCSMHLNIGTKWSLLPWIKIQSRFKEKSWKIWRFCETGAIHWWPTMWRW